MNKIKIGISGVAGKMGLTILKIALTDPELQVVGTIEAKDNKYVGSDIGELIGCKKTGILIESDIMGILSDIDVLMEFTSTSATLEHLKKVAELNKRIVIGTTGFTDKEYEEIKNCANTVPLVLSPNMSIGVNILFKLVQELSKICPEDYDIEIFEAHHRFKKDAPSGTAKKLAEIIANEKKIDINKRIIYGREGITGERGKGTIGIHAVRGGDIVGEHTVSFIGLGERIELTHKAHSRDTFARGSLLAAKFIANAKPGIYEMKDVLGIR